jgi:hypothetical protein
LKITNRKAGRIGCYGSLRKQGKRTAGIRISILATG